MEATSETATKMNNPVADPAPEKANTAATAAPRPKGSRKKVPATVISPTMNAAEAASHTQRQTSGSMRDSPSLSLISSQVLRR